MSPGAHVHVSLVYLPRSTIIVSKDKRIFHLRGMSKYVSKVAAPFYNPASSGQALTWLYFLCSKVILLSLGISKKCYVSRLAFSEPFYSEVFSFSLALILLLTNLLFICIDSK